MGRSKRAFRKRNKDLNFAELRKAKQDKWNEDAPRKSYESIVKENKEFDTYYKMQKIIPESEWDAFMATISESLPTAFRITGTRKAEAQALLTVIKNEFFKDCLAGGDAGTVATEGEKPIAPICIPWYPDQLAWQLQLTRKDIRSSEVYFRLHHFLIAETGCGNISRQEVVSMIPPIVLDVRPHHKVLDMCAAPGSKTAQLIEFLHADNEKMPTGFVIANDVDNKRCYMLTHQAKRLSSPCIIITNHDSAVMPNFKVPNPDGSMGVVKFDRILCDVPCSGDGTLRKNPDIWTKWNAANGSNLHGIQARIVRRGVEMLTVGGRLVYSTCSLNPVENEAVIHRLLVETEGAVKLVDISAQLPGLKYNPGMSHWLPASRDLVGYAKYEDVPEKWQTQVRPMMFPPKPEDVHKFSLEKCIRILPHHQDTGGFFVAVLEKTGPLPWESAAKAAAAASVLKDKEDEKKETNGDEEKKETNGDEEKKEANDKDKGQETKIEDNSPWGPPRKKRRIRGYKEDPFVFFDETEAIWPAIKSFYVISEELQPTCLLTRCTQGKKKNIYITSPVVRDIVLGNQDGIKVINTGVKVFVRCDNRSAANAGCAFRLAQDGLSSILPFIGPKRKLSVTRDDLVMLLTNKDPQHPPEVETLDPKTQEQAAGISQGSCVLAYSQGGVASKPLTLEMVGWRGLRSVRAYVPVDDAVHYLRLCGADVSKFIVNKFKDRSQKDANGTELGTAEDVDEEEKSDKEDEEKDSAMDDEEDDEIANGDEEEKGMVS